jgi:hypothetical protein
VPDNIKKAYYRQVLQRSRCKQNTNIEANDKKDNAQIPKITNMNIIKPNYIKARV